MLCRLLCRVSTNFLKLSILIYFPVMFCFVVWVLVFHYTSSSIIIVSVFQWISCLCVKIWFKSAFQCSLCPMVCHKKCVERCQLTTNCSRVKYVHTLSCCVNRLWLIINCVCSLWSIVWFARGILFAESFVGLSKPEMRVMGESHCSQVGQVCRLCN